MENGGVLSGSEDHFKRELDIVLKEADELKEEGNSAFRSGNYSRAVEVYTRSLERVFAARESVERHQEHERHQALRRNNSDSVSETRLLLPVDEERISLASAAHTLRAHGLEGSATSRRCGPPETSQATAAREGEETGDSLKHRTDKDLKAQLDLLQQRVLCNRALCYLRLQAFDLAEADCTEVLILEPSNAKALYRRACAYEEQKRFVECLTDLQMLLQCGQGPGTEPADRRQQEQMVCRVRDKLLREEKHQQEMQQPRALMAAALSADENCAPEERVAGVRKAVALLHRNPAMRKRFLRDGSLLAVSEYLASAPVPQQQKGGEGAHGDRGGHERGSEEESFVEGELAPLSPALEAACWELLLRCVVDEAAEEQSQQQEADRRAASGGGGSTAGERGQTTRQPQNQERGCLGLLRQQWSSEQLLLRLRRLLRAGATTTTRRWQQGQQQSRPQGSLISSRSGDGNSSGLGASSFSTAALWGRGSRASSVAARNVPEAAATAAGGPVGTHNTQRRQNESSDVVLRTEEKEQQAAAQARMEACCYLLQLMGKLEQLSAHFFEDDAAFCTACLVGMQQTNCLNIQLAAVDAATTAATCRRKLGLQQAPALALRQNIEKWLEELLQLLADLQPHTVSAQLAQQQAVQQAEAKLQEEGEFLSRKEGEDKRRRDVGCTQLESRDSSKRDRLEAQVECLLVTLVGLLVDKVRALPPLFAAARRSSSSGREWRIGAQTKQQRAAAAATAEAADVSRLLEQLLAPYLPLSSSSMFLDNRSSDGAADCVRTVLDSLDGCRGTQEKEGGKKQEGVARNSSSSSIRVLGLGSGLAERRDADVEETVTHQIVGLKVLRLLLPAAREEISQFLIADMCGVFRFAVAAAADDVRVRLPHTPRLLWLQQQAAAAQLLAPAMDFPELRHRLLQADGLQSLTVVLCKCCNSLRSTRLSGFTWGVSPSTAASMETAMRWVVCGKIAAVLARLAVHHEEVRVQVFDLVDFIKVLDLLLQRWEEQQQLLLQQEEQQVVEDVEERGVLLGERREAAGGAAAVVGGRGGGRNVPAAVAAVQQRNEACQDFAEVFCFVSLHGSFKERLANDDEGLLQRLLRQVNAAFGPAGDRSAICRSRRRGDAGRRNSSSRSGNSGNRNLVLLLLLQGLCNLMRSRDDRQRRPSSRRPGFLPGDAGGGPQLDEEQQEQLQRFFEQLPSEAQPPRNGQIDAGGKEIAGALQARLVSYGVVHVVASIVLASLRAAAAAQQEEEGQGMRRRTHSSSNFHSGGGMTVALQLEQHLSPNALVAAADALAALAAKPIYRGNVVREGGLRALLGIITFLQKQIDRSFSYEAEQRDARQALARLCVSVNPSLITYQEMHEAIGYVIPLLRDGHELLQYEAALAITNLTSSGAEAQAHAWHAGAWDDLEELLFSDNPLLRAAGLEGWCNLADSVVVQRAIGERCDRLWQAEARRATLAAAGQARGSRTRGGEGDEEEAEEEEGNTSRRDGVIGTSQSLWDGDFARDQFEVQCLKILLAYCLEDENVRARHAAIAALAMLVTDPRTAAAAVRCSNFSNLCLCLDQAHLDTNADAENTNRYTGDSLILRVVATINHLWVSLRDSDSRHCCDFDGLTLQLQDTLFRNKHKLKGIAFDLAQELSV